MDSQILYAIVLSLAFSGFISFFFPWLLRFLIKQFRYRVKIGRLPQGPRPLPVLGNALPLLGGFDRVLQLMHIDWPLAYGDIFVTYIGSVCNVNVTSPELMQSILRSQKIIDKGITYSFLKPWLGDGLLLSTGFKWRTRRRLLTPAFHYDILDKFVEIFNRQSLILCELLGRRLSFQSGKKEINVYPYVANCSLDIICETTMDVLVKAQYRKSDYVQAVYRINQIVIDRCSKPWLANDFIFPFTLTGIEHSRLLNTLHVFTQRVIKHKRERLRATKQLNAASKDGKENYHSARRTPGTLLDILLESENYEASSKLTDKDIEEEIGTFTFEGFDTITSTVSWFLYCMAEYEEHQEKVWNELQDIFGDSERYCSQEDLSKLTYLDCCMKETLRLYPPLPHIERYAKEDFQLGEYLIPSGTNIILLLYGMHHHPRLFPNPFVFDPSNHFEGRHGYSYLPFSAGPRNCIAHRFASMEVKVVVSNVLRHFKVSLSPLSAKPIPSMQTILKPLNGIHLFLSPR